MYSEGRSERALKSLQVLSAALISVAAQRVHN